MGLILHSRVGQKLVIQHSALPSNLLVTIIDAYIDHDGNDVVVHKFDGDRSIVVDRGSVFYAKQEAKRLAEQQPADAEPPVRASDAYRKEGSR